ncbi:MAG: MOSC domain-containing protein [Verrucomicrobiota bacterium]
MSRSPIIRHLFISPGHNYFGHHGKEPGGHPIEERNEIELVAGCGVRGDRFFGYKENYKGQVTLFEMEVVEAVRQFAGKPDIPASAFRRNVITSGIDLNEWIGRKFSLNGILLEGTEECRPCYWMDSACGKSGTEELMQGRGGLRCRILSDGVLKIGAATIAVAEERRQAVGGCDAPPQSVETKPQSPIGRQET